MSVYYLNTENTEEKTETQCVEDQCQTQSEAQAVLAQFWPKAAEEIRNIRNMDLKQQVLPLARIKKIMKLDEDVKMISAEAPLLFAKAAEIFIQELTLRAWVHTEDNKRRTLQRNDIAMAISKYDQFDFLIDIVPRDDIKPPKPREDANRTNSDQVYYFQLAQQHHANLQQNTSASQTNPTQNTIQIVQPQPIQTVQIDQTTTTNASPTTTNSATVGQQSVLIQTGQTIQNQQTGTPTGNVQILQQIVTPTGEIQQIPINLTPQQLQMIKMQLQGNSSQPVIIQTAPIAATAPTGPTATTATAAQPHLIQVTQQNPQQQVFLTTQTNGNTESE